MMRDGEFGAWGGELRLAALLTKYSIVPKWGGTSLPFGLRQPDLRLNLSLNLAQA